MKVKVKSGAPPPKDGSEVTVTLEIEVPVYWDDDLQCWVLSRTLTIDTIKELG